MIKYFFLEFKQVVGGKVKHCLYLKKKKKLFALKIYGNDKLGKDSIHINQCFSEMFHS